MEVDMFVGDNGSGSSFSIISESLVSGRTGLG